MKFLHLELAPTWINNPLYDFDYSDDRLLPAHFPFYTRIMKDKLSRLSNYPGIIKYTRVHGFLGR